MGLTGISPELVELQRLTRNIDEMARAAADDVLGVSLMRPEPDALKLLATPDRWKERPIGYLKLEDIEAVRSLRGKVKMHRLDDQRLPVMARDFETIYDAEGQPAIAGAEALAAARQRVREAAIETRVALDDNEFASPIRMIFEAGDGRLYSASPTIATQEGKVALTVEQPAGVISAYFHSLNDSIRYMTNGTASSDGPFQAGSGVVALRAGVTEADAQTELLRILQGGRNT